MNKLNDEKMDFLFKGILTLESVEECYSFFEDLCTVAELQEMSKRLMAAKMLKDNYIYTEIAEKMLTPEELAALEQQEADNEEDEG